MIALPPERDPGSGAGPRATARRAAATVVRRGWRVTRRVLPDSIADPLRDRVRAGLQTAGLLGTSTGPVPEPVRERAPTPPTPVAPSGGPKPQDRAVGRRVESQKPVVFFHVMKCGGTSVRVGLSLGLTGARDGADIFELDGAAAMESAGGRNSENWQFRDVLLPYVVRAMSPALILGHFRYRDEHCAIADAAHFVTVLRDPIERMVSLYKYRRYKSDVDVPVAMELDEFIATKRWAKEGHAYVDTFCGRDGLDPRSDAAVDAAVENLQRFAVVGFTDRLDDFSLQMSHRVGGKVRIPKVNASPAPTSAGDELASSMERIREICAPDLAVYERVRTRLT